MSKPSVIIVPGSWHCREHYGSLAKELESHGYKVVTMNNLPTTQSPDLPPKSLSDDNAAVRSLVMQELDDGKNVVVAAHSFGGHATNGAVKGLDSKSRASSGFSTAVLGIAFIAAIPAPRGPSLLDAMGGKPGPLHDLRTEHLCWVNSPGPEFWFYNDLPEDEAKKWAAMIDKVQSWVALCDPTPDTAYVDMPCGYLYCLHDNALPHEYQKSMVAMGTEAGARFEHTETVDSGHSPFLSMPKRTAEYIRRVAGENVEQST